MNEWNTDNILAPETIRRQNKFIWRRTLITINFHIYYDSCMVMMKAIYNSKAEPMEQRINNCNGHQNRLFLSLIFYLGVKRIYQLFTLAF